MKNAILRTRSLAQLAIRAAVVTSISLAVFLLYACETNMPSGQRETPTGPQGQNGRLSKTMSVSTSAVPLGSASTFAVLGYAGVTTAAASDITGDLGAGPGAASATGFDLVHNTIVFGPGGSVTDGIDAIVHGTIYAGGPIVVQAQNDADTAYNYLMNQVPDITYSGVTQLNQVQGDTTSFNRGVPLTPGVYKFDPSANLKVGGTLYLDFQGNSDALFIFQFGTTLVAMANSNIVALNNPSPTCFGSNVYWAVGSSASIDGAQFLGTVIAKAAITMSSSGTNVSGRLFALGESVTMVKSTIAICGGSGGGTIPPPKPCRDFVTGGGWIDGNSDGNYDGKGHKGFKHDKATFGVSGGFKNGKFWGQLSFNDHDGMKVKSTSVTAYIYLGPVTRQIEGFARVNGKGSFAYKVIVADNGERGRNDFFSLELAKYSASGTLNGGNIQLHTKCGEMRDKDRDNDKDSYDDKDERDGHHNCDND